MDMGTEYTAEERQRIVASFMRDGVLTKMPAQRKKQLVILEEMAKMFEPGQTYTEREVNGILAPLYEDFVTLRRDLIEARHMTRDHGIYQRVVDTEDKSTL